MRSARRSSSSRASWMARAISKTFSGFASKAASPSTSSSELTFDATTGVPVAMATGTPVVASNVSSLLEVLGDAALLANPENVFEIARAIQDALLDEDLRADLIAKGKAQAARYSWDRTARDVLEVYREVSDVR